MIRNMHQLAAAAIGCIVGVLFMANRVEWMLPLFLLMLPIDKVLDMAGKTYVEWSALAEAGQRPLPAQEPGGLTMLPRLKAK